MEWPNAKNVFVWGDVSNVVSAQSSSENAECKNQADFSLWHVRNCEMVMIRKIKRKFHAG